MASEGCQACRLAVQKGRCAMFGMTMYDQKKGQQQVAVRKPRDLFDYFFGDDFMSEFGCRLAGGFPTFRADIREHDKEYVIEAELPGLTKEDVKIDMHDDVLTISAEKKTEKSEGSGNYVRRERQYGSLCRSFRVEDVDHAGVKASFENGLLAVTLPKQEEAVVRRRVIDIN